MFCVFNANPLTDMGKTIRRKHLNTTDAQAVWQELNDHMKTSSKGASKERRLTQYVTNTVLDDSFKGSTEQFVLHLNEQFRQLYEISDDSEKFPTPVKLTLVQNAVRRINDLRIVKLWMSSSPPPKAMDLPPPSHTQTYYNLLINTYVRSDLTKKANVGKRRNVYSSTVGPAYLDYPLDVSDLAPESPLGGIDLPSDDPYPFL